MIEYKLWGYKLTSQVQGGDFRWPRRGAWTERSIVLITWGSCWAEPSFREETYISSNSVVPLCDHLIFPLFKKMCQTRRSKHCGFSIYIFDNSKSKSMVRLVRAEKMVLSGLVFARKIARMILIQNIQGLMGPLMINMAFMPLYM